MTNATAFPEPWGYDQLIGDGSINIFNASLEVWRNSAAQGMAMDLTFGMLPVLLLVVVYVRTRKIGTALFVGLVSTWGLRALELSSSRVTITLTVVFALGLGMALAYALLNKT